MSEIRTEEEQIQAFKQWWKENGKSLILGVGLAVAIVVGWRGWQERQAIEAENASVLYQNMVDAVVAGIGPQQDQDQLATAKHLAGQLKDEYSDSSYAKFASLVLARVAVESKDYDNALAEIDWVLANQPTQEMKVIATMRKARLLAEKGDRDAALKLISALNAGNFKASVEELKGDLLLAKGDRGAARAAYEAAQAAAQQSGARPLLNIKLDDLAVEDK
ncbi:tetratricopeptide repeat protein [Pontibacterium granulatum]|uniref:YfgM family protein n=1 Tax=Pontibacterium granulatum TaxID=2036029 RepID=UPI00249BB4CD|nr:tetratricopeptide repeat protein [Pontibacterium granulatum]MDI3323670.1 tetratricopeptide repeat protein [Pontibacterium granulatum]